MTIPEIDMLRVLAAFAQFWGRQVEFALCASRQVRQRVHGRLSGVSHNRGKGEGGILQEIRYGDEEKEWKGWGSE